MAGRGLSRVERIRLQLRAVELLRQLKEGQTYSQLSGITGEPITVLNRYVKGRVVPSEAHMAPILRVEAKQVETEMDEVGWLEASQLTPDIPERSPFAQHPNNIALAARLCGHLLLSYD